MKHVSINTMIHIAMSTAIISIVSQFSIPMPSGVPATLQIFIVSLIGFLFPTKQVLSSILLYLLLGCVGVPVFANFKAGIFHLLGLTGGFLLGLVILIFFCSLAGYKKRFLQIFYAFLGLLLCHTIGILQYSYLSGNTIWTGFLMVSAPYLIKDLLLVFAANIVGQTLKSRLKNEPHP